MQVSRADMAHNKQTFFERPEGSVFERETLGWKTELWTNHALVHLPTQSFTIYEYNIDVKKGKTLWTKRDDAGPTFRNICKKTKFLLPDSYYVFNDVNMLWSTKQLPRGSGVVGNEERYHFIYKFTRSFQFGESVEHVDSQLFSTLIDAIATSRVRFPQTKTFMILIQMMNCSKCKNKYKVFNRNMFMIQDRQHDDVFEKAPIFVSLQNGIDIRTGISIGIKLNLRAGITACYDLSQTMFTRPCYPIIRLLVEIIQGETISDEEFADKWDKQLIKSTVTEKNQKIMERILNKMLLRYTTENALKEDESGKWEEENMKENNRYRKNKNDFTFFELVGTAERQTFIDDTTKKERTVAEYYLTEKNIRLRYPNLPCIRKRSPKKFIAYPMEFVTMVVEPQRFDGYTTREMKAMMINRTSFTARQRRILLQHIISQKPITDIPAAVDNNDAFMRNFGVVIEKSMLKVNATVLPPPTVVYGGNDKFTDEHSEGAWKALDREPMRKVLEGSVYVRTKDRNTPKLKKRLLGSILKIAAPGRNEAPDIDDTNYHNLMKAIEKAGQPVVWENEEIGQAAIQNSWEFSQLKNEIDEIDKYFQSLLTHIDEKYKKEEDEVIIPICFVIFESRFTTLKEKDSSIRNDYNEVIQIVKGNHSDVVKYLADNKSGIYTQGMLFDTFNQIGFLPASDFTSLIVEKILGKVGTTHRKLDSEGEHKSWKKVTNPKSPTLILGVDVCHPNSRDRKDSEAGVRKLSVASIVGNIDIECNEYRSSSKLQSVGEEKIVMFKHEVKARIDDFTIHNAIRPAHIVVYRDGFSEGDFKRILYEEKLDIENAGRLIDPAYQPTITYIVVTKRHHTRFFLTNESEGIEEQRYNVLPGTLVEDTVTTKNYYDFYLTTQVGQVGLARPTHYYVLWNTWKCRDAFWPTLTHALTYTFCRTTTTVSVPAPVLYAHLAAKRAKETLDGAVELYRKDHERDYNMESYADVAELTRQINNHPNLDGMIFV
ncbi:hypothetical protein CRE_18818 [Caenorhabditis remanei]|uniref:Piwi domain-containing protein n=1 Tax=Caenorhabditis remanei TaxID=31234 RepID=E3LKN8_CAERE|nr:hypothetical protein CRE_18818 [Caenorhabditis remanei]